MITENDLRETLRAQERLAPDAAPVAARIATGVRTRRRHRYAGTAAVALATAVAVAVPTLALRDAGPAGTTQPAAGSVPTPVRFGPLTMPFTVGWLPAGWFEDGTAQTNRGIADRTYENRRNADQLSVRVWDTEISGQGPDVDLRAGGTIVRRQLSETVWGAVSGPLPRPDLERVLRSVDVRTSEALRFPFRLTWLPPGVEVLDAQSGTHHWFGNAKAENVPADPPLRDSALSLGRDGRMTISLGVSTEDGSWQVKGLRPNGVLLGRPRFFQRDMSSMRLHVFGVQGMHILVYADVSPGVDRAALERLVNGLRLVPNPTDPAGWTDRPMP